MMIKICGITNLDDALAAARAGAGALGFVFYPASPRAVTAAQLAPWLGAIPPQILKVGVFVNSSDADIADVAAALHLDVVQLHGDCTAPAGFRVWRAVAVQEGFDPAALRPETCEAYLLDAPAGSAYGGAGRTFDWDLAGNLRTRIIVAGGLDASNVAQAIARLRPWGVDASSRLESAPGKKDHKKVEAFIRAARAASTAP